MKGILIFDSNHGRGSCLGHSQKWCVNLPEGRFHVESWIMRGGGSYRGYSKESYSNSLR